MLLAKTCMYAMCLCINVCMYVCIYKYIRKRRNETKKDEDRHGKYKGNSDIKIIISSEINTRRSGYTNKYSSRPDL